MEQLRVFQIISLNDECNMKLTWGMAYYGLSKNFISPMQVLSDIDSAELQRLDTDTLGDLYAESENSTESFRDILKRIVEKESFDEEKDGRKWALYFLEKIRISERSTHDKLREVASLWATFAYPESWKGFIHYMPSDNMEEVGEDQTYKKFLNFILEERKAFNM